MGATWDERAFGKDTGADVCQPETAELPTGPVELGPAEITVWVRGNTTGSGIDADEARELAKRLLEAAAALDQL